MTRVNVTARVPAKGNPRKCPTCRTDRDLFVKAHRGRQDELLFRGFCVVCTNLVGDVPASKVDEADQVRLELALDESSPPTLDMFAKPEGGQGDGQ